jgi:hypothetical protein
MPFIIAGLALLVAWGAGVVFFTSPGWIHLLLSAGLALAIYGVVTPKPAKK